MNSIITPQQMAKEILKCLEDSVADLPEDEREEVKAVILNGWSNQMFYGKKK
jgi:DNA-directed RNA polymerase specialized sigma24 family protein